MSADASRPEYICTKTERITRRMVGNILLEDERFECEHVSVMATDKDRQRPRCLKCGAWLDYQVRRSYGKEQSCAQ